MLSKGKQARSFLVAASLAFGIFLLGACSGGGGGSSLAPTPQQPALVPPQSVHTSISLSDVGKAIALPPLAGYAESITLTSNSAPAGTDLALTISTGMPKGVPAMPPDFKETQGFLYFSISSSKTVTLNGFPGFTLSIPPGLTWDGGTLHLGFYDPSSGWQEIGDVSLSGRTMTFTPTKTPLTLKAGVNYVVVPFACVEPSPSPSPSPTPTGVVSCEASGTGAIGVLCAEKHTYAFVGKGIVGSANIEQIDISAGASASSTAPPTHTYSTSFHPEACAGDEKHLVVWCGSYFSGEMTAINASSETNKDFASGASGSLSFSGGSCVVCAIAYDPTDNAFILEEANESGTSCASNGCGQFARLDETTQTPNMTITTSNPNENPGYDYVLDWIFNPQYEIHHLETADFSSKSTGGKLYVSSVIANMNTPDSGCVDVATHVAETGNEYTPPDIVTLANLGTATESGGTLTVTTGQTTLTHSDDEGLDDDACATDSVLHVTFFAGEFGTRLAGFALLPTTMTGTTISDWAFAVFPNTPDGGTWESAFDPHPIAAFNSPGQCDDCALSINQSDNWLAVIDLNKLTHAPRSVADKHEIDPTYNLLANHVIAYYKI